MVCVCTHVSMSTHSTLFTPVQLQRCVKWLVWQFGVWHGHQCLRTKGVLMWTTTGEGSERGVLWVWLSVTSVCRELDGLSELLSNSDYVCNILPSTPLTRGLLNGDTLRHCASKVSGTGPHISCVPSSQVQSFLSRNLCSSMLEGETLWVKQPLYLPSG